ncbi:MAG TPA: DUF3426 domain-containing protein [Pseudoxanthomonas sp.]|nr:DUF3426 domain-containing protein [Pseudoxanthomonas sp.]
MFIACPQCRYLVATDPRTQAAPARCSRCGAALQTADSTVSPASPTVDAAAPTGGGQSLASLLRRDDEPADARDDQTSSPAPTVTPEVAQDVAPTESTTAVAEPIAVELTERAPVLSEPGQEMSEQDNEATAATDAVADASDTSDAAELPNPAPSSPRAAAAPVRGALAPAFLRGRTATTAAPRGTPLWQWLLAGALLLSLLLQMLLADRARLAADAGWRPLLSTLCQTLGCSLPAWREPQAFVMLDRDVRPVPHVAGVLQARATFRNDARWSQPWPILLLTLKDADGRDLGARAITPAEYLRGSTAMSELAPGQSAQVAVTLREPSANVVAFSFDFR